MLLVGLKAILNPKIVVLDTGGTRDPAVSSVCMLGIQTTAGCLDIEYHSGKRPFLCTFSKGRKI